MATWRIDLANINGAVVQSDLKVMRWTYSNGLNGTGSFEATMFGRHSQATEANLKPGAREVRVYRDGTQVWGGYLWSVNVNAVNTKAFQITLRAESWFSRLRRRYVLADLLYRDVNQETIAWNLINHTQGQTEGNLGFTLGSHTGTSLARERNYCSWERHNIAAAIEELANQDDGFDFDITPAKVFNTYYGKRGSASGITIDGTKAFPFDYDYDASDMANYVTGLGNDDCNPVVYDAVNSSKRTEFGLLQAVEDYDTNKEKDVVSHVNSYLQVNALLRYRGAVTYVSAQAGTPAFGTLPPGDTFTLTSTPGFANFSTTVRVVEHEVIGEPPNYDLHRISFDSGA